MGVQMWDLLNKADIEQAKQDLKLRRAEILRRHAVENQNLDADRLESETLYRLVDMFVQKFIKPPIVSHAPIAAPVAHQHVRDTHRDSPQTVFATFVRAQSRHH